MSQVDRVPEGIRLRLDVDEAALVRVLTEQILDLLGDPAGSGDPLAAALGISENPQRPDDPVLARLFPDAYREDDEAAREFRRYTEAGLRDGKREAAGIVLATLRPGEDVVLDAEQAQAWLRSLNDVRLALGTRLNVTEDWEEQLDDLDPADPLSALYAAYDWLTLLQERLVRALW